MKRVVVTILIGTGIAATGWSQAPPTVSCTAQADTTPRLRAGGNTELLGDVLITCTGGTPTPAGSPVPMVNIQAATPAVPITSRLLNAGAVMASEALLIIDEPAPGSQQTCAASQAPCALTGTGTGIDTYGPRNVFQGRQSSPNGITWTAVPFDPPGSSDMRVLRITNVRIAAPTAAGQQSLVVSTNSAGIENSIIVPIANSSPVVGVIEAGLGAALRNGANTDTLAPAGLALQQCVSNNLTLHQAATSATAAQGRSFVVRFSELFATALKRRNTALPAPPATGDTPPTPVAQNTLTAAYQTETGFFKPDATTVDGFNQAGLAASGTRLFLRFTAPAGAKIFAAVSVPVTSAAQNGVARLITTIADGSGAFTATASTSPLEGGLVEIATFGDVRQAVYEIVNADPAAIESIDIPVYIAYDAATVAAGTIVVRAGLGPTSTDTTSTSAVVPRFLDTSSPVTAAAITACGTPPLDITPATLPQAAVGTPYSQQLGATGTGAPFVFRLAAGTLPTGVTLTAAGLLAGTPTQAGTFAVTIGVTDAQGRTATRPYSLVVTAGATDLLVAPASLEFRAISNGATPPSQIVLVSTDTGSFNVEVVATTQSGGAWLRLAQNTGAAPFVVEVAADPTGLAPGDYSGEIEFRTGAPANITRRVAVRFSVGPAEPPLLVPDPPAVTESVPLSRQARNRTVNLINRGSSNASFTLSIEYETVSGWLAATPLSGTVNRGASLPVQLSSAGEPLPAGVYRARLRIRNTSAAQDLIVPVTLGVAGRTAIQLSQTGLTFRTVTGAPAPRAQSFQVLAAGEGGFNWTATTIVDDGLPQWLSVSRTSGASGDSVDVSVNPAGLAAGDFLGEVRIQAQGVENSPRILFVSLKVLPAPPVAAPDLDVSPTGLVFVGTAGQNAPAAQTVSVFNGGTAAARLEVQLQGQLRVFTVTPPANANLGSGDTASIQVAANTTGLAAGIYRTTLTIRAAGAAKATPVDLLLIVTAVAPRTAASTPRSAEAVCPPGGLNIVSLRQAIGFGSATGLPLPVEARVLGNDGLPLAGGAVTATLTGTASTNLNLVQIESDPVRWSGTLQPPSQASGAVALRMFAQDAASTRTGCLDLSGTFDASDAPVIAEGGVLSASSFARGAPMASGGMAAIFGARLATASTSASSLPLPFLLGETRVTIGGRNMPLFFAGDQSTFTQVNGILPYGLTPNVSAQMAVRRGGLRSFTEVIIATAQPAVFTLSQNGAGQAIVVHGADPLRITDAASPAVTGETIVIYAEGLGAVTPAVEAGSVSPASPLAQVPAVRVTIGGINAPVSFAGLTPGLAGLYQVNAVVPAGVVAGDEVPVIVTVAGYQSPAVTIAIR